MCTHKHTQTWTSSYVNVIDCNDSMWMWIYVYVLDTEHISIWSMFNHDIATYNSLHDLTGKHFDRHVPPMSKRWANDQFDLTQVCGDINIYLVNHHHLLSYLTFVLIVLLIFGRFAKHTIWLSLDTLILNNVQPIRCRV